MSIVQIAVALLVGSVIATPKKCHRRNTPNNPSTVPEAPTPIGDSVIPSVPEIPGSNDNSTIPNTSTGSQLPDTSNYPTTPIDNAYNVTDSPTASESGSYTPTDSHATNESSTGQNGNDGVNFYSSSSSYNDVSINGEHTGSIQQSENINGKESRFGKDWLKVDESKLTQFLTSLFQNTGSSFIQDIITSKEIKISRNAISSFVDLDKLTADSSDIISFIKSFIEKQSKAFGLDLSKFKISFTD